MKQSASHAAPHSFNKEVLNKITAIEKDIMALKMSVLSKLEPTGKKVIKLKGIIKDSEITDEDIDHARTSLYSKTEL